MDLRVLGVSGSPRNGSNSEILLSYALGPFEKSGWEITRFHLNEKKVQPCTGCDYCIDTGKCVCQDDMSILYEEYVKCDALIIASPAYYRNITAQLKAVFDRTYAVNRDKPLTGKLGGAIAVGRGQDGGQSLVLTVIHNFYLSSGVLCVPGELNGVAATADKPGDILSWPNRLRQAEILGENLVNYANALRGI